MNEPSHRVAATGKLFVPGTTIVAAVTIWTVAALSPGAVAVDRGLLVQAGFGKRVMFGSDQMVWPRMIEVGIEVIEAAEFLSEQQKRDILYNNAARFLRLEGAGDR